MHVMYLGIGSNLGDRQANILHALQRLRRRCTVEAVSGYYESPAAEGAEGPPFLNVAASVRTTLEPGAFEEFVRDVEVAVGRRQRRRLAARPIDIDILLVEGLDVARRPFNLIPLAEIAPDLVEPVSGKTIRELAGAANGSGIVRRSRSLQFDANRQEEAPDIRLAIARAGVSNVKRVLRLKVGDRETVFNAELSMVADLAPDKTGVHMSRFAELLEEAALDVLAEDRPLRPEDLAATIAQRIVASQRALRADVRLRASFGLERWTPVSGKRGEETYTLVGLAHAGENGVRQMIGVEAEGMTACPCAQAMVREHSHRELLAAGFDAAAAERALDALPVATHNQRGLGSVTIGTSSERIGEVRAEDLVEIVESSMSSETYDLLKRPDEFFVVNKAHHNPRFVEDVVRGILAGALEMYADFPDDTFVLASQVNYESIHKHDAIAESFGTFGELRAELRGEPRPEPKTDRAAWLGTRASSLVV